MRATVKADWLKTFDAWMAQGAALRAVIVAEPTVEPAPVEPTWVNADGHWTLKDGVAILDGKPTHSSGVDILWVHPVTGIMWQHAPSGWYPWVNGAWQGPVGDPRIAQPIPDPTPTPVPTPIPVTSVEDWVKGLVAKAAIISDGKTITTKVGMAAKIKEITDAIGPPKPV